ncbi:hypothetical protein U14_05072 [Candidatus Moduliflexus flocculans]|uniref:Tripartite ATP-independent periplasmic transporters DctQ component domain-containing protein n=1 Tax=Candidatus Moduliflexus flocculans TaxID=1499966 RepID=A0A081BQW7_9BACT|nr:hypothetical protein U14_05072 [Candidatus Moduliflexus flocculans]
MTATSPPPHVLTKILRLWQQILEAASIILLCGFVSCIFLQIVLRNFFNFGHAGIEEVARMQFVTMVYFMIPVVFCENGHLQIDMFTKPLKGWAAFAFQLFALIAILLFTIAFLRSDYLFMKKAWNVATPALALPNIVFFAGPYVGMISLLIFTIERFVNLLRPQRREE